MTKLFDSSASPWRSPALAVAAASRAAQGEDVPAALVERKAEELLAAMPTGERGALKVYGSGSKPHFDQERV